MTFVLQYVIKSLRKDKRSFAIGFSTIFVVVAFLSLIQNVITNASLVFLKIAEDRVGQADLILRNRDDQTFLNFTSMEESLASNPVIHGLAPRWFIPSFALLGNSSGNRAPSKISNVSITLVVLDSQKEKKLGIGSSWPYRELGGQEIHLTSSVLRALNLKPQKGERVQIRLGIDQFLEGFGISLDSLSSVQSQGLEQSQSLPNVTISIDNNTLENALDALPFLNPIFENITRNGSTITLTPSNIAQIINVSGIPILNFEGSVTVIDGIEGTFGKYPFLLGNVGVVDISFMEALLKEQIISFLSNPIVEAILGDSSQTSIDFVSDIRLADYALTVYVLFKNRMELYMKSSSDRRESFVAHTNEIASSLGYDNGISMITPLLSSLDASDFISILLDEIFFTVITILAVLAIILIYSLLLADVEEKTFEYGLIRCLGITQNVIIKLLFTQATTFAVPAILLALLLSFWLNTPIAYLIYLKTGTDLYIFLRASAVALGVSLGIILPIIGMIVPVRRALTKTLRDALDIYHKVVFDTYVSVKRLEDFGLSIQETILAVFLITFGIMVYYVVPYAFLFRMLNIFFRVLTLILLVMVVGQILVTSSFQSFMENVILKLILHGSHRKLKDLILKNLQSHRTRNTKTSSMFTICLSYVIFAATMFTLQAKSLSQTQEWFAGADIAISGGNYENPLPQTTLQNYLNSLIIDKTGPSVVVDYTFITVPLRSMDNVIATVLSHVTFFNDPYIQLYGIEQNFLNVVKTEYFMINEIGKTGSSTSKMELFKFLAEPLQVNIPSPDQSKPFFTAKTGDPSQFVFESNASVAYSNAYPYLMSTALVQQYNFGVDIMTFLTIRFNDEFGRYRWYNLLSVCVATVDKVPSFPRISGLEYWDTPVLISIEAYHEIMSKMLQLTGSSKKIESKDIPKSSCLIKVDPSSSDLEIESVINNLNSILNNEQFQITNLKQDVNATQSASDLILTLFNVVALIGIFFSFFVLWLSFTANLRENSWEFGILRALGLSGLQVVYIYIYEAETIVISCIIQGILIGCVTGVILTLQFNLFVQMPFMFYINVPVTVVLLVSSIVVSFWGSFKPASKMKDAIATLVDGTSVKNAAKLIDVTLANEHNTSQLNQSQSGSKVSNDYFFDSSEFEFLQPMIIPEILYEQYDNVKYSVSLGLFPEIKRAYLAVDHRLFLWNFEDGSDFCSYDELDQPIVGVGLSKPKTGVFIEQVKYLLVLATPVEIVLVGLSKCPKSSDLQIYNTNLAIPSDNINMIQIASSDDGRIFMLGKDGNIYEFKYKSEEGWFSRKCSKVNLTLSALTLLVPAFLNFSSQDSIKSIVVDSSRSLLYALTENSHITVYSILKDSFVKVAENYNIINEAQSFMPHATSFDSRGLQIIAIHAISIHESRRDHLMATTSNGTRLFFTTFDRETRSSTIVGDGGENQQLSSVLELLYIRLPAERTMMDGMTDSFRTGIKSTKVHTAYYSNGAFIACSSYTDDEDSLFISVPSFNKGLKSSRENCSNYIFPGKTWTVAELPEDNSICPAGTSELHGEQYMKPRKFLILTNSGINVIQKLRPIDTLKKILINRNSIDSPELRSFFDTYSRDQACSICLLVACGGGVYDSFPSVDVETKNAAAFALFKFGGDPQMVQNISSYAYNVGQPIASKQVVYSGIHNGLLLLLSRVISPIFKRKFVSFCTFSERQSHYNSLSQVLKLLASILNFTEENPMYLDHFKRDRQLGKSEELDYLIKAEKMSISNLENFLRLSIEAISLIIVLLDFNINEIFKREGLPMEDVQSYDFEMLLSTSKGHSFLCQLIDSIIKRHIEQQLNIDPLTELLHEKCPNFVNLDDMNLFKASENLAKAKSSINEGEKEHLIDQALVLFEKCAKTIKSRVSNICVDLVNLNHHFDATKLCLHVAEMIDPENLAKLFYDDHSLVEGKDLFVARKEIYDCIFTVLDDLERQIIEKNASALHSIEGYCSDLAQVKNQIFNFMCGSKDEIFHFELYSWIMTSKDASTLLEINSPFLEKFLIHHFEVSTRGTDDLIFDKDLLWKFYVKNQRFEEASSTLDKMADLHGPEIKLEHRIEYLSLALSNAKCCDPSIQTSDVVMSLEERLDVSKVQLEVREELAKKSSPEAYEELNSRLMSLTELYNDWSSPWELLESSLSIIACAGYRDNALVSKIWQQILEIEDEQYLVRLGRKFAHSDVAFPIELICDLFLKHSFSNEKVGVSWTSRVMAEIGIPALKTLICYFRIFDLKIHPWSSPSAMLFLIEEICYLLENLGQKEVLYSRETKDLEIESSLNKLTLTLTSLNSSTLAARLHLMVIAETPVSHPSDSWVKLGNEYYEKFSNYELNWRMNSLHDKLVKMSCNGGPIAVAADPKKASYFDGRTTIKTFSASGSSLGMIKLEYEKVISFGWSKQEQLVVILAEGQVRLYELGENSQFSQFTLDDDLVASGIMDCKFLSDGVVLISRKKTISVIESYKTSKAITFKETLPDFPYALAVVEASQSHDKNLKVFAAVENGVITMDSSSRIFHQISVAPVIFLTISGNGKFVACFLENSILRVGTIDFGSVICEFECPRKTIPNQVSWCGSDAVCLVWDDMLMLVGPGSLAFEIQLDSFSVINSEIDGLRLLSKHSYGFLCKVSEDLRKIFEVGSISSGAVLFDVVDMFERQSPKSFEIIRQISSSLGDAVSSCLEAAKSTFNRSLQKKLLRAAGFGKLYLDSFKAQEFVETCKTLRLLNNLRNFEISLPLTWRQLQDSVGKSGVLQLLMRRGHYFLASRVAEYFDIPSDSILVHWACKRIQKSSREEEEISSAIISKLENLDSVSFSKIAETAYNYGQKKLAVKLLDHEKLSSTQVPLLITMGEDQLALKKAVDSGDSDLIYLCFMHLKRKYSLADFFRLVVSETPKARFFFEAFCADYDEELLQIFYYQEDLRYLCGKLHLRKSLSSDLEGKLELLQKGLKVFNEDKSLSQSSELVQDELNLIQTQMNFESEFPGEAFCGSTLISTLYKLFSMGLNNKASKLKSDFRISDKRYSLTKARVLIDFHDFAGLEQFLATRKPACGYKIISMECLRVGRAREALKYVPKCNQNERTSLYVMIGKASQSTIPEISEIAVEARNSDLIRALIKISTNPMTREDLNQKLTILHRNA